MKQRSIYPEYCYVLHSRSPRAKFHKADPKTGLPSCGVKVGVDALENERTHPPGWDPCGRCYLVCAVTDSDSVSEG